MKVIVPVVNNPNFIRLQYELLKIYMPCEFEFIVFNDAKQFPDYTNFGDTQLRNQIINMCNELGISCINLENDHHQYAVQNASSRHADSLRVIKIYMQSHPDSYLMIDSDMFPISTIPIDKYATYQSGAIVHQRSREKEYMWPNLFYLDTRSLPIPNFDKMNWDLTPGYDTGAMSHEWLALQNQNNIFFIKHLYSLGWGKQDISNSNYVKELVDFLESDLRNINYKYWCEIYDDCFLHYRAGSNWNGEGKDVHHTMANRIEVLLQSLLYTKYMLFVGYT